MNILFLTMSNFKDVTEHEIYPDLMRCFIENGHSVMVLSPAERRYKEKTQLICNNGCNILRVKVGNLQKTNLIEKGISTILIESQFISAIKKHLSDYKVDLLLYSTPPITFVNVIKFIKNRDKCKSYLMLKDIFPQNAVDLGMFGKNSAFYKFFRKKEKELYSVSDHIGCMSTENIRYVKINNPEVDENKLELCPNSISFEDFHITLDEKIEIRNKYLIPDNKIVYVYGGNLGAPQGIPFLIDCLKTQTDNNDVFFVIVGSGTKYTDIQDYLNESNQNNVALIKELPKKDYDCLVAACDVGMLFLDSRFTIPNYPSRILKYMQFGLPVLAATDNVTDIKELIESNDMGVWVHSDNTLSFSEAVINLCNADRNTLGNNSKETLKRLFDVRVSYSAIVKHLN